MGSVLASRMNVTGPPMVVMDGDTRLEMVPGYMRQTMADSDDVCSVGAGAANPTDPHDALLLSFVRAPVADGLKRLQQPRRKSVVVGSLVVVVGTVTEDGGVVTVGVMYDQNDAANAKWVVLHGGGVQTEVRASGAGHAMVLHCDASVQVVHNAGVSCRVHDGTITIHVQADDILW